MGILDQAISLSANQTAGNGSLLDSSPVYSPDPSHWFKSRPYAFKARIGDKNYLFYLPINPSNINITTHYATNVVTTLYSTVEEHSEQRYFDITIQGTTGFAPKYVSAVAAGQEIDVNSGRASYSSSGVFGGAAGGFFAKTLGKIDQAANKASDTVNTALGNSRPYQPGVFLDSSGYMAFHNLYRFFLDYKKAAAAAATKTSANDVSVLNTSGSGVLISSLKNQVSPLYFLNYKDNNKYSCAIQRFVMERNSENPMLYNYSISFKAYNLSNLTADAPSLSLSERLDQLGLTTKPSILSRFKLAIRNAKSAVNSVGSALTTLGG